VVDLRCCRGPHQFAFVPQTLSTVAPHCRLPSSTIATRPTKLIASSPRHSCCFHWAPFAPSTSRRTPPSHLGSPIIFWPRDLHPPLPHSDTPHTIRILMSIAYYYGSFDGVSPPSKPLRSNVPRYSTGKSLIVHSSCPLSQFRRVFS